MGNQVYTYTCPGCGSVLTYSAAQQMLTCPHCHREFSVTESSDDVGGFDWGDYRASFDATRERLAGMKVYQCRSCGATLETGETSAALTCPYCRSEVIITDRLSEGLKPNGIIPFRIDKRGLKDAVRQHIRGKRNLPFRFLNRLQIGKVTGVYVPFWLYRAEMSGSLTLRGERITKSVSSDTITTTTSTYEVDTDGSMHFENVAEDGAERMQNALMDSVADYDYSELKPFNAAYLSGFLAERFSEGPDHCLPRAEKRMLNTAMNVLSAGDKSGLTHKRVIAHNMRLSNTDVRYVLLPVYLLNLEFEGATYSYAVNGQNGRIVGDLPFSRKIMYLKFAAIFIGLAVLLYLLMFVIFV